MMQTHLKHLTLVLVVTMGHLVLADVTIDLAKAVFDENLGQFCVMQKVGLKRKLDNTHMRHYYRKTLKT